jgi:hypothetical protein
MLGEPFINKPVLCKSKANKARLWFHTKRLELLAEYATLLEVGLPV